jgi:hypothetical protein
MHDHVPSDVAVVLHRTVPPSNTCTVELASAVPVTVSVRVFTRL